MRPLILFAVLVAACGGAGGPAPALPPEVRDAPERVDATGRSYTLEAQMNRDFMPIAPSGGRPMAGMVFLRADALGSVPEGMRAERVWVIRGAEHWEVAPEPLQTLTVDRRYHLQLVVRDGPKWDVGSNVRVVLRFAVAGQTYVVGTTTEITGSM